MRNLNNTVLEEYDVMVNGEARHLMIIPLMMKIDGQLHVKAGSLTHTMTIVIVQKPV